MRAFEPESTSPTAVFEASNRGQGCAKAFDFLLATAPMLADTENSLPGPPSHPVHPVRPYQSEQKHPHTPGDNEDHIIRQVSPARTYSPFYHRGGGQDSGYGQEAYQVQSPLSGQHASDSSPTPMPPHVKPRLCVPMVLRLPPPSISRVAIVTRRQARMLST